MYLLCWTAPVREFARREMEVVKVLQHPNLIKTLDVFDRSCTAPYAYIVMELLPHRDLATLIKLSRSATVFETLLSKCFSTRDRHFHQFLYASAYGLSVTPVLETQRKVKSSIETSGFVVRAISLLDWAVIL